MTIRLGAVTPDELAAVRRILRAFLGDQPR
jgi:hypothetical protein